LKDRPGFQGVWGYQQTNGLGLYEYLLWAEDFGMDFGKSPSGNAHPRLTGMQLLRFGLAYRLMAPSPRRINSNRSSTMRSTKLISSTAQLILSGEHTVRSLAIQSLSH
jgi:hypothetical protein